MVCYLISLFIYLFLFLSQVRVSDVYPTGEVRLLQDSAIRMRWREGGLTPLSMAKGEVYEARMSIWNTSYIVAPGHALRFGISSSNFPRFDVNPNNGILLGQQSAADVNYTATNIVYHSAKYPSHVTLPVVALRDLPKVHNIKEEVQRMAPGLDIDKLMLSEFMRLFKLVVLVTLLFCCFLEYPDVIATLLKPYQTAKV